MKGSTGLLLMSLLVMCSVIHSALAKAKVESASHWGAAGGGSNKVQGGADHLSSRKNKTPVAEGSGDGDDEDEDYFYYEDKSGNGTLHGSGGDDEYEDDEDDETGKIEVKLVPDVKEKEGKKKNKKPDDIHFDEESSTKKSAVPKKKKGKDEELYEYYSEYYEEDYAEEKKATKVEKPKVVSEVDETVEVLVEEKGEMDEENVTDGGSFFKLSYVYIMLASAFLSFSLALLLFFVCRRSAMLRKEKQKRLAQPFLVTDHKFNKGGGGHLQQNPIVKNYQRVPTSTKEFLVNPEYKERPLLS